MVKKNIKKLVIWGFVALVAVGGVLWVLVAMSDNELTKAARACDSINIEAKYNETDKTLTACQIIDYKNRSNVPFEEVKFHIHANAYREGAVFAPIAEQEVAKAFPVERDYGHILVTSVTVGGNKVEPHFEGEDETVLCVHLPSPLSPNKKVKICIDYTLKLANIEHRLGWTNSVVNLGNFYPVPVIFEDGEWQVYPYSSNGDPFYNAVHNYKVSLTVPSAFVVASSGTLQKETVAGGNRTALFQSKAIRDFAMVASKQFKVKTRVVNKVAVNYYYINDTAADASLETSVKALQYFSRIFTSYPYKQLNVVQTDFLHGGMEYGELVYISSRLLENNSDAARREHNRVIVHEIAHQWWYGLVGNNQTRTAWIDEGLAEFSTLLFFEAHPEYKLNRVETVDNARLNLSTYIKIMKGVGGEIDVNMNRDLNSFNSSTEYVLMTYVRGMLIFCELEKLVGKDKMICALADVANTIKFGIVTQAKLMEVIEKCTKTRLELYFATFVAGHGHI